MNPLAANFVGVNRQASFFGVMTLASLYVRPQLVHEGFVFKFFCYIGYKYDIYYSSPPFPSYMFPSLCAHNLVGVDRALRQARHRAPPPFFPFFLFSFSFTS